MKDIREVLAQKERERNLLSIEVSTLTKAIGIMVCDELLADKPLADEPPAASGEAPMNKVSRFDLRDSSVQQPSWIEDSPVAVNEAAGISEGPAPPADLNTKLLRDAQAQHISDLRVLLDKSAAREDQLAGMVKMVMEERYFRPVITGKPPENKGTPAIAPEHLQDVATFDEKEDAAQSAGQEEKFGELNNEFNSILKEHNEAHQGK